VKDGEKFQTFLAEVGNLPMNEYSMIIEKVGKNKKITNLKFFNELMEEINWNTQKYKLIQQNIDRKAK
jgi:hypothetical protein